MKKYTMTLDTETSYKFYPFDIENGKNVKPIWNIAWIITESTGKVVKTANFYPQEYREIVAPSAEVDICERPYLVPAQYLDKWEYIIYHLIEDMTQYGIDTIGAYNAMFDRDRIRDMNRYTGIDLKLSFYDIWNLAVTTQCLNTDYFTFCETYGYISEKGNLKTSAEIMYRYLTQNTSFVEAHLALDDCRIEAEIYRICNASRCKTKSKEIRGNVWRLPQAKYKEWKAQQSE